jgi:hypothetical protein
MTHSGPIAANLDAEVWVGRGDGVGEVQGSCGLIFV